MSKNRFYSQSRLESLSSEDVLNDRDKSSDDSYLNRQSSSSSNPFEKHKAIDEEQLYIQTINKFYMGSQS